MAGRKVTFDTEKATKLYENGFKYKEISKLLNVNESTLKSFFKRNIITNNDMKSKRKENKEGERKKKKENIETDYFELEHSNLLNKNDMKEIREEKNNGIMPNESIGTDAIKKLFWQSFKLNDKKTRYIFDESRGLITHDMPKSYT